MSRLDPAPAIAVPAPRVLSAPLNGVVRILLALTGGLLLGIPWFDQGLYWTAWIGSVPLLLALHQTRLSSAFLLGWLSGTLYFAIASYWIIDFIINLRDLSWSSALVLGLAFWCYAGLSVGLSALLFRWVSRRLPNWDLLSFPLCMVVLMNFYPLLFGVYYAEAQSQFLLGLQGVALLGVKSMDIVMLLTGVLLYQLLVNRSPRQRVPMLVASSVLVAWFGYGFVTLHQWDQRILGWETRQIGLVQPNDAVTLGVPEPPKGFSREYPEELAATERLAAEGAELVIWPEARYKGYFELYTVRLGYAEVLQRLGIPLILHDAEQAWAEGESYDFNSLVHLDTYGEQQGLYRKMVLMPFGEYLPDFFRLPGIGWLTNYFFGEFLRPLHPGDTHEVFEVNGMRIMPKICYEAAFPRFVAEAIGADAAGKVLLFVSQDNWFGESTQPFQHASMSVVRAVENRVPMIHLINNGPSVVAAPNGRITAKTEAFLRSELVAPMPFAADSGGSLYSRYPLVMPFLLHSGIAMLLLLALFRRRSPLAEQ
ncbi:MAG: apolipoprotein N-acyltransferase [Pseudomonas sp.]